MNDPFQQDLSQLGKRLKPDDQFVSRVMEQIDRPKRFARNWSIPISFSLAAVVLLSIGAMVVMRNIKPATPRINSPVNDVQLERTATRWQTVTERAVTLEGDVPAREVRQQEFERVRYVDPGNHATFERVVPREPVTFVRLESY